MCKPIDWQQLFILLQRDAREVNDYFTVIIKPTLSLSLPA